MVKLNTKTNYKNECARVRQGEKSQNYRNDIMIKVILKAPRNVNKAKIKKMTFYITIELQKLLYSYLWIAYSHINQIIFKYIFLLFH